MAGELESHDPAQLRISDAERHQVAEILREAAGEGRLDLDELDERLEATYAARTYADLVPITFDLPAHPDRPATVVPVVPAATAAVVPGPKREQHFAILSGVNRKGVWVVPEHFTLFALMGGAELDLLETDPDIVEAPDAIAIDQARGDIAFEDVSFSYESRVGTLEHVTFAANAGDRVAIVGPTGAGKSTLLALIPRIYDPAAGRVLMDGHDIRTLKLLPLREQISIVHQEPLLFSGSIMENIRYGRLDATEEEVVEAARNANAHEFIAALPNGYETTIGERGAQLSGGERQRVAIARAFVKDAPILILDEPTSAIDSKTEGVILEALERLMEGRTTFMVAHRMSTIRDADLILVVNHGELVERGSHEELIEAGGLYRQLHDTQTGARRGAATAEVAPDQLAELTTALAEQRGGEGNGHVSGPAVAELARAMAEQELGDRDDPEAAWLLLGAAWPLVERGETDRLRALAARAEEDDVPAAVADAAALALRLLEDLAIEDGLPAAEVAQP